MRGSPETMRVLTPESAPEALRLYSREKNAIPLAGGTDFMVAWNAGLLNGGTVLDLSRIKEWSRIEITKDSAWLGALVTHSRIQKHPVVPRAFPLLAQACAMVGAEAIQNRGTIGGNIANASPAGDTFPPLAVYEAAIHAASASGKRVVPFLEIFSGVKKTTLRPGEIIESIAIPFPNTRPSRQIFRKVGTRAAQAISKTVAAGLLWMDPNGRVRELRFALGSMATTVRRLTDAEAFVKGKELSPAVIAKTCELLEKGVSPIDDIRSTREYRLQVSKNILRGFLESEQLLKGERP